MTNKINKIENLNNVHLIDISKKMISKAKENLKKTNFSFEVADFDTFKIIKFMIFFFKYVIALVRKFLKTFFSSIKSNTLGRFFNFFNSNFN